jgi:hypothetical protein
MNEAAVTMSGYRTVGADARRLSDRSNAERDQHQSDQQLEQIRHAGWHLRAQNHEERPHQDQRQRMTEAPRETEESGPHAALLAADECRDGCQMIRLERVPHPDKRSES